MSRIIESRQASMRGHARALARWMAVVSLVASCSAPLIGGSCPDGTAPEAGVCTPVVSCTTYSDCALGEACIGGICKVGSSCAENAECSAHESCIGGVCGYVGECVVDANCGCAAPTCVAHTCAGTSVCTAGPAGQGPAACKITADCEPGFYCIEGRCLFATQCLENADCPADDACFHELCYEL